MSAYPLWLDPTPLLPYFVKLAEHFSVREPNAKGKNEIRRARNEYDAYQKRLRQMKAWHERNRIPKP